MRLPKFDYLEPKSLKEAAKALAMDLKGSVLLAGGTDLLVNMETPGDSAEKKAHDYQESYRSDLIF